MPKKIKKTAQMAPPPGGMPPIGGMTPMMGQPGPVDMGQPPPTLEEQITDMIYDKISRESPHLIDYIKDIKTVDKSEETGSFIFAVNIETPAGEFVLPVFVSGGVIKPMTVLYDKKNDNFIPNTKAWLEFSESALYQNIGVPAKVPKDLKTDVDIRNLVIPPTTGRYAYASDPELVVLEKIATLSDAEKKSLLQFFTKNKDILIKAAEVFGEDNLKVAFSMKVAQEKPVNKPVEVINSLDDAVDKKNRFYFNSVATKGYAIKDNRKGDLNRVVVIEEPEYYFKINQPGIYRVWTTEGIKDVVVGILVDDRTIYKDRASSVLPATIEEFSRGSPLTSNALVHDSYDSNRTPPNYFILGEDKSLMLPDSYIREDYTALKILDPSVVNRGIFKEIFGNIHETNINTIKSKAKTEEAGPARSLLENASKKRIFISVKPNGAISGYSVDESSIDSIVKKDNTIIISVRNFSPVSKLIYDPDISGQDFKVISNGHESFIILPYNVKVFEATKAKYDILNPAGIDKYYKNFITRLGAKKIENINNVGMTPEKQASEIADLALMFNIPIPDAELVKAASIDYPMLDMFVIDSHIGDILYKFASALEAIDGVEIANALLKLPETMAKIGQATAQMMMGGGLPPPPPAAGPGMPPPEMAGPVPPMGPEGAPGPDAVIDEYINTLSNQLKELSNKTKEIQNTLSILADIKSKTGSPMPQDVTQLIRDSGEVSNDAFSAAMTLGMINEAEFEENIAKYLPVILKGIDSVGRIIVNINAQAADIGNKFGDKFRISLEDKANKVFKQLGDFYMFLRGAKVTNANKSGT